MERLQSWKKKHTKVFSPCQSRAACVYIRAAFSFNSWKTNQALFASQRGKLRSASLPLSRFHCVMLYWMSRDGADACTIRFQVPLWEETPAFDKPKSASLRWPVLVIKKLDGLRSLDVWATFRQSPEVPHTYEYSRERGVQTRLIQLLRHRSECDLHLARPHYPTNHPNHPQACIPVTSGIRMQPPSSRGQP